MTSICYLYAVVYAAGTTRARPLGIDAAPAQRLAAYAHHSLAGPTLRICRPLPAYHMMGPQT